MTEHAAGVLTTYQAVPGGPDLWNMVVAFAIFFGIIYFVALRPQAQERKAHEQMIASLTKDDLIVTGSGIHGRVVEVKPETIVLEIAEKTRITIDRSAVARKVAPDAGTKK